MNNNRRNFLKLTGLATIGMTGVNHLGCNIKQSNSSENKFSGQPRQTHTQIFNMSGFAAPPLSEVRIGIIGIGSRGMAAIARLIRIEGVSVKAICDIVPERLSEATTRFKGSNFNPQTYSAGEEDWKNVCEREDIDLIYNTATWDLHTPVSIYAMEHGKHAAVEVPAAVTID